LRRECQADLKVRLYESPVKADLKVRLYDSLVRADLKGRLYDSLVKADLKVRLYELEIITAIATSRSIAVSVSRETTTRLL